MSFKMFVPDKNPLEIFHSLLFENGIDSIFRDSSATNIIDKNNHFEIYLKNQTAEIIQSLPITLNKCIEIEKESYISDILHKLETYRIKAKFTNLGNDDYNITIENEIETITEFVKSFFPEIIEDIRLKNNTKRFFKFGTIQSPLKFYEDLIFNKEYSKFGDAFYAETIYTKDYRLVIERNKEFLFEAWLNKQENTDMIHYEHYINKVLKYNTKQALELLNELVLKLDEPEAKKFLLIQFNLLNSLIEKCDEDMNAFNPEIRCELISIISNINTKYSHYQLTHKVLRKLTHRTDNIFSFFQIKSELKVSFFEKLYDVAVTPLNLLDDIEISEEVFIEVFTSPNPLSKIQFIKPNATIAFFLKEIEPFFDNFNSTTIEKSRSFLNKQGKVLTSTDLYTALSRNKDKNNNDFIKIQNEINLLKKQYLK